MLTDNVKGFTQVDPFEDTESESALAIYLEAAAVSLKSIRSRILKVPNLAAIRAFRKSFTQVDPFEDTESSASVVGWVARWGFTQVDPFEDTESVAALSIARPKQQKFHSSRSVRGY